MYPPPSIRESLTVVIIVIIALLCLLPFIARAAVEVYARYSTNNVRVWPKDYYLIIDGKGHIIDISPLPPNR